MRGPLRWPVHPAPLDGEALSSWLRRIAGCYDLGVAELLEHDLGPGASRHQELDLNPSAAIIELLARRTGIHPDRLHSMNLTGWTPWLLDTLEPEPSAFDAYVRQFSILLPASRRSVCIVPGWRAWIPDHPLQRACPQCLADPAKQGLLLMWQLPLLLSCPDHGCLLETCMGFPSGGYFEWTGGNTFPCRADKQIRTMDRLTAQALTTGRVRLPRRSMHAGTWFRLLRTLVDELNTPISCWGSHAPDLRLAWEARGLPIRAGQSKWRPFEYCPWPVQTHLLEAAAGAITLLEAGSITGGGTHAALFRSEPHRELGCGDPPAEKSNGAAPLLKTLGQAMEEAIQAAREDPAVAKALYDFALIGCRDASSVTRLRADFAELGIDPCWPSHIDDPVPFA